MKQKYICPMKVSTIEYPEFSDRLKVAMDLRGYAVSDLARKLYLSSTTISMYRNGNRLPSPHVICLLAQELEVSSDFLLGLSELIYI